MPNIQFLNPDTLGRPIAPYSNITRVKASEFLFIAGQVGMNKSGKTPAEAPGFQRHNETFDTRTGNGGVTIWIPVVA